LVLNIRICFITLAIWKLYCLWYGATCCSNLINSYLKLALFIESVTMMFMMPICTPNKFGQILKMFYLARRQSLLWNFQYNKDKCSLLKFKNDVTRNTFGVNFFECLNANTLTIYILGCWIKLCNCSTLSCSTYY
jgi:hypothetical protein